MLFCALMQIAPAPAKLEVPPMVMPAEMAHSPVTGGVNLLHVAASMDVGCMVGGVDRTPLTPNTGVYAFPPSAVLATALVDPAIIKYADVGATRDTEMCANSVGRDAGCAMQSATASAFMFPVHEAQLLPVASVLPVPAATFELSANPAPLPRYHTELHWATVAPVNSVMMLYAALVTVLTQYVKLHTAALGSVMFCGAVPVNVALDSVRVRELRGEVENVYSAWLIDDPIHVNPAPVSPVAPRYAYVPAAVGTRVEGANVGASVGCKVVGRSVVGASVGWSVGDRVGASVGARVGASVGWGEGAFVGEAEGEAEGEADGEAEGEVDGEAEGEVEGDVEGEAEGEADGDAEGPGVGSSVGCEVGWSVG